MYFCTHITTNILPIIVSNYLDDLNEVQRNAVSEIKGPVMIIAGAGSGKTRVLTYRIAHLIKSGAAPFSILALTFTNKAANDPGFGTVYSASADARSWQSYTNFLNELFG